MSMNSISHMGWLTLCLLNFFSTTIPWSVFMQEEPLDGYKFGDLSGITLVATCPRFGSPPPATDPEASPSGCIVLLDWGLTLALSLPATHCWPMVHGFNCSREIVPVKTSLNWSGGYSRWCQCLLPSPNWFGFLRDLSLAPSGISIGSP